MISITFEQKFLPTDTVVEFGGNYPDHPQYLYFAGLCIVLIGLLMAETTGASLIYGERPKTDKEKAVRFFKWLGVAAGAITFCVGVVFWANHYNDYHDKLDAYHAQEEAHEKLKDEQRAENMDNLLSNIETIYDIESIEIDPNGLWNIIRSDARRWEEQTKSSRLPSVEAVVLQDGKAFDVLLSQDPDTYEPLLSVRTSVHSDAPVIRKK